MKKKKQKKIEIIKIISNVILKVKYHCNYNVIFTVKILSKNIPVI